MFVDLLPMLSFSELVVIGCQCNENYRIMRDLVTTLDEVIAWFPTDVVDDYERLIIGLDSVKNSAVYTPPECMRELWIQASNLLREYLGEPDEEWKQKIQNIWLDKDKS